MVVCTFGDGTSNRGDFHEALNLASVWKLPVVYVCQHNQYSISLHAQVIGGGSVAAGRGYGMPGRPWTGTTSSPCRTPWPGRCAGPGGEGPSLIEALTYRLGGHWASDPEAYRATGELEQWRLRDPLPRLEAAPVERGDLDRVGIERLWSEVRDEAQRAVDAAQAAPARARRTWGWTRWRGEPADVRRGPGGGIRDEMRRDPDVFMVGQDVGVMGGAMGGARGLFEEFRPRRVRDAPISESAMVGAAVGAALVGSVPSWRSPSASSSPP